MPAQSSEVGKSGLDLADDAYARPQQEQTGSIVQQRGLVNARGARSSPLISEPLVTGNVIETTCSETVAETRCRNEVVR
jgi:hypothetical protein